MPNIAYVIKNGTLVWITMLFAPGMYMPFEVHLVHNNCRSARCCDVLSGVAFLDSPQTSWGSSHHHSICTLCMNMSWWQVCSAVYGWDNLTQLSQSSLVLLQEAVQSTMLAFWLWNVHLSQCHYHITWPNSSGELLWSMHHDVLNSNFL